MSYTRWSNDSNWYIFGGQDANGCDLLTVHHCRGNAVVLTIDQVLELVDKLSTGRAAELQLPEDVAHFLHYFPEDTDLLIVCCREWLSHVGGAGRWTRDRDPRFRRPS